MALLATLIGTAAVLAGLWLLIQAGWWLTLRGLDPLLERSRDALRQERILRRQQEWERHRQALARQRDERLERMVDLDGQVRWLPPEEIQAFLRCCWSELELEEGSAWSLVRQQWRRRSLRWHPDHGGDPALWLRKQRAYEALKHFRGQARPIQVGRMMTRQLSARRQRAPWRGLRGRRR